MFCWLNWSIFSVYETQTTLAACRYFQMDVKIDKHRQSEYKEGVIHDLPL